MRPLHSYTHTAVPYNSNLPTIRNDGGTQRYAAQLGAPQNYAKAPSRKQQHVYDSVSTPLDDRKSVYDTVPREIVYSKLAGQGLGDA